jgi:nicotinamide-nucleotide amidase
MVRLRLTTFGTNIEELKKDIDAEIEQLKTLISNYIFGYENYGEETPSLADIVSKLLREQNKTLALAESCTGGYIASLFTAIAGASDVFKGAIVPYTNAAKHNLLQVDESVFASFGAVSKECVEQLAQNVLKKFDSDYAIAVSGIAGPTGGTDEKPVGTIWIAVASKEKTVALKFLFGDNRQRNIVMTSQTAINLLRKLALNTL